MIFNICLFLTIAGTASAQGTQNYRGSIPMELLRPGKGEALRYPIDTIIGQLGQGTATDAAFSFANWVAAGLLSGRMNHPALESINSVVREGYLSTIGSVEPRFYRLGSGRQEPDGSTSFLVRFVGREQAITAEMYIRHVTMRVPQETSPETVAEILETAEETVAAEEAENIQPLQPPHEETAAEETENIQSLQPTTSSWALEDLLLDEVKSREQEQRSSMHRIDYVPYERFF